MKVISSWSSSCSTRSRKDAFSGRPSERQCQQWRRRSNQSFGREPEDQVARRRQRRWQTQAMLNGGSYEVAQAVSPEHPRGFSFEGIISIRLRKLAEATVP